jgi:hypothetical protein
MIDYEAKGPDPLHQAESGSLTRGADRSSRTKKFDKKLKICRDC